MKDREKDKLVEMVRFEKIQISKLLRDVRRKSWYSFASKRGRILG